MTLQEILDAVLLECGLDTETVYFNATDDAVRRMAYLANRAARVVLVRLNWQRLRKAHVFTLSANTQYDLPSDFRALVPDTAFVDSYYQSVDFRVDPSLWRYLKSNSGGSGPRHKFRILGGQIEVYEPTSGDQVSFEYVSDLPVLDTDGTTYKARFDADTDTWILDDDLLILAIIWRYKGLLNLDQQLIRCPYTGEMCTQSKSDYNGYLKTMGGQEAGAKTFVGGEDGYVDEPYTDLWV